MEQRSQGTLFIALTEVGRPGSCLACVPKQIMVTQIIIGSKCRLHVHVGRLVMCGWRCGFDNVVMVCVATEGERTSRILTLANIYNSFLDVRLLAAVMLLPPSAVLLLPPPVPPAAAAALLPAARRRCCCRCCWCWCWCCCWCFISS